MKFVKALNDSIVPREKDSIKNNDEWADKIEWKIMPGETCPACLKNNHNVYKTGCPSLLVFAACSNFYHKTPKENTCAGNVRAHVLTTFAHKKK